MCARRSDRAGLAVCPSQLSCGLTCSPPPVLEAASGVGQRRVCVCARSSPQDTAGVPGRASGGGWPAPLPWAPGPLPAAGLAAWGSSGEWWRSLFRFLWILGRFVPRNVALGGQFGLAATAAAGRESEPLPIQRAPPRLAPESSSGIQQEATGWGGGRGRVSRGGRLRQPRSWAVLGPPMAVQPHAGWAPGPAGGRRWCCSSQRSRRRLLPQGQPGRVWSRSCAPCTARIHPLATGPFWGSPPLFNAALLGGLAMLPDAREQSCGGGPVLLSNGPGVQRPSWREGRAAGQPPLLQQPACLPAVGPLEEPLCLKGSRVLCAGAPPLGRQAAAFGALQSVEKGPLTETGIFLQGTESAERGRPCPGAPRSMPA